MISKNAVKKMSSVKNDLSDLDELELHEEIKQEEPERERYTLSVGLSKNAWSATKIRDTVLDLGKLLVKLQAICIDGGLPLGEILSEFYGSPEKGAEMFTLFNELITGFTPAKAGRKKGGID